MDPSYQYFPLSFMILHIPLGNKRAVSKLSTTRCPLRAGHHPTIKAFLKSQMCTVVLLVLETPAGLVSVTTGWVKKPSTNLTHILPQGEEGGEKGNQTALDWHWLQTQHRKASSSHGNAHQVCQGTILAFSLPSILSFF